MEMGSCKLCLNELPLLKKSHIIPQWMYFGLFDASHKTSLVNLDDIERFKRPSSGIYDSGILCANCDNAIISNLENYGKTVLCDDETFKDFFKSSDTFINGGLKCLTLNNVDLGLLHSEAIRKAIVNGDSIAEDKYEVAIVGIENLPDLFTNTINNPRKIKKGLNTYFVVLINGLYFLYNISPIDKSSFLIKSSLKANGQMTMPLLEGNLARIYYDSLMKNKLRRANN
jgi:hypothetical protein